MYRHYENPYLLQPMVDEAERKFETALATGADEDRLLSLHEDMWELRDRLRFAWDDYEFDMEMA